MYPYVLSDRNGFKTIISQPCLRWFIPLLLTLFVWPIQVQADEKPFQAGVSAIDISPQIYPVRVNGSFLERQATELLDPIFARAVALDDGKTRIVLCVVDSCMMPQDLIDRAKAMAHSFTGLQMDRMMVSATHTHSAPSAMACLGSREDPAYVEFLPGKIAEAIEAAVNNLQPAQVGWASVDDWAHVHNRRWIRRSDKLLVDPYGKATARAHMHPGFQSKDIIGPSGPVDPELSILAARALDGTPIALLANYAPHYFGSGIVSADYYGVFCNEMAQLLNQESSEGAFVAMMSQGTSGDQFPNDYHSKKKPPSMELYAKELAASAKKAYNSIVWHDKPPIVMTEIVINLNYRQASEERLAWAKKTLSEMKTELPTGWPEVYSQEALILHERKNSDLKLQAIRIGTLGITTFPNEVYAITGLKMKRQTPLESHINIELANGAVGYIPPPEQHELGGYTTWAARTAGLDVLAEPIIVDTLLGALEEVSGERRKLLIEHDGPYAKTVKAAKPVAYWRLNEIEGRVAHSAIKYGPSAKLSGGVAVYLPGVATGAGGGDEQELMYSSFSGPEQFNRSMHFVIDGRLEAQVPELDEKASVAFWFWLGEVSGVSQRSGTLCTLPSNDALTYDMDESGETTLTLVSGKDSSVVSKSVETFSPGKWHFAVLEVHDGNIRIFADGAKEASATLPLSNSMNDTPLRFAKGMEGKLDEIAVFDRILTPKEKEMLWRLSGVPAKWLKDEQKIELARQEAINRAKPPIFPNKYKDVVASLNPVLQSSLNEPHPKLELESGAQLTEATYVEFAAGRINLRNENLDENYSISLWFKNILPNNNRAVTGYMFSRGTKNEQSLRGDHLGIGGTYQGILTGKLILYNGDTANQVVAGKTSIPPDTWNHLVMVRKGNKIKLFLNGSTEADIDSEIPVTSTSPDLFLGSRSDHFAPFEGYMAQFALFNRALSDEEAKAIHAASNQPVGTAKMSPPKIKHKLASQPLDPISGQASIYVPDGYTVDLVAAEPQVFDPVAFDWDVAGNLWVVEMADYPLGLGDSNASGGRIRKLEDRDGDSRYETSSLFASGLNFPTGILTWREGIIVTAAPDIVFLQDTTGDGKADTREVLLSGLTQGNQQLRANGLRWGLDNWVYVAAGGHHGNYGLETKILSLRTGTETKIGSRDFRFRPDTGELEPQSGPTQFGRNRDNWGRWFGTQNSHPLWHYTLPDHYLKRNPYLAVPDGRVHVLGKANPPVYPASRLQKRYHNFQQSGRYTSACSGMIYRDTQLFSGDATNGFVCEPFQNLVQWIELKPDGVSFTGKQQSAPNMPDFFASDDRWCRPVMARTGPDGGLWVADMYRYMIEHPDWLPEKGKQELLPFYRKGDDRGRIYRVRKTSVPKGNVPSLQALDTKALVDELNSSNGWVRDKAQQLLLWRDDPVAIPLLKMMATNSSIPLARLHALCTLDGLDNLSSELVTRALKDAHPGVRENALRMAESRWTPRLQKEALNLVTDSNARIRQQLAFTLGAFPESLEVGKGLNELLLNNSDDVLIRTAALSSALPHQTCLINELLASNHPALPKLRISIAEMALASGNKKALAQLVNPLFKKAYSNLSSHLADECAQLLSLLKRHNTTIQTLCVDASSSELIALDSNYSALVGKARSILADSQSTSDKQIAAAILLTSSIADQKLVLHYVSTQITPDTSQKKLETIVRVMSQMHEPEVADLLLGVWADMPTKIRAQIMVVLLSRIEWTQQLLQAISQGEVLGEQLAPVHRARLMNHTEPSIKTLALTLLKQHNKTERSKVVEQFAPALSLNGEASKGQIKYAELCASCHKFGAKGFDIGPDLSTVSEHPTEKLLANILDPNLDIQPGYHAYNCELNNGDLLFGLITSENATSITLKMPGDVSKTLLRSEIKSIESSSMSMMPEGWEESLNHQDMANLIAFLKQR